MAQSTMVVQIPKAQRDAFRQSLEQGAFEFRSVPHAYVSVKGEGVVATLYESGKLVIQGESPLLFVERYVGSAPAVEKKSAVASAEDRGDTVLVGSDESGKGDYFGPLVVAAVRLEPAEVQALRGSQVRDSKTLSDALATRLSAALRTKYPHVVVRLDPVRYNATYKRPGQLNGILADLHAEAIQKLYQPGMHVLIDQFANEQLMRKRLASLKIHLMQRPRAESHPAVAAASIIAREEFLTALHELSERFGVDLHKGAGTPVDKAAQAFVELHGAEALANVAKLHFKNTERAMRGRSSPR